MTHIVSQMAPIDSEDVGYYALIVGFGGGFNQSRVRIHNQNKTTAAKAQADRKTLGHRSYRVATLRQSLSRAKLFSILWRFRYRASSCGKGILRLLRDGMQGVIPFSSRPSRYQSASLSYPPENRTNCPSAVRAWNRTCSQRNAGVFLHSTEECY